MKHRDRIIAALNHEEADRCPMQVSFTPEFADRLKADLTMSEKVLNLSRAAHNPHGGGNTYELERTLGVDMLQTSVCWANGYYGAGDEYTDEWGVTWHSVPYETPFGTGHYTEMIRHPLAEDGAISQYHAPDPNRPELYRDAQWTIDQFKDEFWIVGVTVTTIWEAGWGLRGYDRLLSDLVTNPDLAEAILDIPYNYHLTAAKRLVEMGVDMIWIGDDVGSRARHAHVAEALAALPQTAHGLLHRRSESHQPAGQGCLSHRRRRLAHHPRPGRDRAGHPEPDPAGMYGSG